MMDIANHAGKGETDILARYHMPHYLKGEIGGQIFALQNFIRALRDVGFTESEVQAIAWDNALRVIRKVLG